MNSLSRNILLRYEWLQSHTLSISTRNVQLSSIRAINSFSSFILFIYPLIKNIEIKNCRMSVHRCIKQPLHAVFCLIFDEFFLFSLAIIFVIEFSPAFHRFRFLAKCIRTSTSNYRSKNWKYFQNMQKILLISNAMSSKHVTKQRINKIEDNAKLFAAWQCFAWHKQIILVVVTFQPTNGISPVLFGAVSSRLTFLLVTSYCVLRFARALSFLDRCRR